ncbi:hypothetical protein M885DRAFT_505180 [Pelagophyceae sp. CCMP2097]|nr:hypothetical protein M885DRAFT_505180 [Pelagophyceae sp. CCMP2097]|mmetsp:Transcript_5591/g.19871  ORF Transcript_5591/g.19871 Transcript_5591/m.19871 type:complete len:97 (+) Transcript_5591:65-355(+)
MAFGKPEYKEAGETHVTIRFASVGAATDVEYKEYPEDWNTAKRLPVTAALEYKVEQLNPNSTYNFRLVGENGAGPELVVDTQAPNCTPTPRRCAIL